MAKSHIESVFMSVKIMHQLAVLSIKEINANGKLAVAGGKLPSKRILLLTVGAQWRTESVTDVCDLGILSVVANDCDNVELHLVRQMVVAHIGIGCIHHVSDFGWSNGIEWIYHSVECSGFYFYDDYPVAFLGNDVDFELIEPPITLAHDIAILYEVFGCHVLPYLS